MEFNWGNKWGRYTQRPRYIIHPTRIVNNAKPSLIDNIFANTIEHTPISDNLSCKISDHLHNFLILQEFGKNIKVIKTSTRDYKHFNKVKFVDELQWRKKYSGQDSIYSRLYARPDNLFPPLSEF